MTQPALSDTERQHLDDLIRRGARHLTPIEQDRLLRLWEHHQTDRAAARRTVGGLMAKVQQLGGQLKTVLADRATCEDELAAWRKRGHQEDHLYAAWQSTIVEARWQCARADDAGYVMDTWRSWMRDNGSEAAMADRHELLKRSLVAEARADQAEAERDGAYRERAHLTAWLATVHPAVLAPAPDIDDEGWQILYLTAGGRQLSWHIHPRDAELYAHVEHVSADDPRAQWDGHTTAEKYEAIRAMTLAEPRGYSGCEVDDGTPCCEARS